MSSARINIDAIPKLSHDPSSYAPWRAAVEIALQLSDCWNAALGLDIEPGQAVTADRRVRAGSVMPTGSEAGGLSWEDKREWERWQARESRAQAILKGTASQAIRLDIEDLLAAADMWKYCDRMHEADLLENQRIVQARLWTLDLKGDATADDMSAHVETFSKAIADGKRVGIVLSDRERAQRFLSTILDPAFNIVRAELAPIAKSEQTWSVVLSKYTAEIARRRARPPHGGSLSRGRFDQYGLTERNHGDAVMVAERRRVKARKGDECWRCGEMGHWERDCKAARQRKTHRDRRDRQSRRDEQSDTEDDDDSDSDESSDDERSVADKDKRPTRDNRPTKEKRITIPAKASTGLLAAGMEWIGLTVAANEWADLLGNPWAESKAVVTAAAERIVEAVEPAEIAEAGETACEAATAETTEAAVEIAKTVESVVERAWVIDSGATHHLTPHRSILKSVRTLETPVVFGLASGGTVEAVEVGEVDIALSGRRLTLQDVYLVPTARVSVCSLSRLLARGWHAEIKDEGGTLQREDETLTMRKRGSLWTVALKIASQTALGYTAARDVEAKTAVTESQGDVEGKAARFGDQRGAGGACDEKETADTGQRTVDTAAELEISPAYQSEVPLTKSPATAVAAHHLEALRQEDQYAAQEDGYMRLSAVNDDQETSGDTETTSSRRPADDRDGDDVMPHHVSESRRRNADSQLATHRHRLAASARATRDCMHAGGAGEHWGRSELPEDTKIIEIGGEMTENERIASDLPGRERVMDRATPASVVPGLDCHGAKIDRLQDGLEALDAVPETLNTAAETLEELQPADFEGEC